jgi:hypothetical protein
MSITIRPIGQVDAQLRLNQDSYLYLAFQGDYLLGTNLIYKGFARPGASIDAPVWQIAFITYDASNNITSIQWPLTPAGVASNDFIFTWSARAGYTYV